MKKLLTWLFTEFRFNGLTLTEWAELKFTKQIAADFQFALFKNNAEIPQTRFTATPASYGITQIPPFPATVFLTATNTPTYTIVGNATIDISQVEVIGNTGDIELRCVGIPVTLYGPDVGGQPTSSVRASLNIEKIA